MNMNFGKAIPKFKKVKMNKNCRKEIQKLIAKLILKPLRKLEIFNKSYIFKIILSNIIY